MACGLQQNTAWHQLPLLTAPHPGQSSPTPQPPTLALATHLPTTHALAYHTTTPPHLQVHYLPVRPEGDASGVRLSLTAAPVPRSAGMAAFAAGFHIPPGRPSVPVAHECCNSGPEPLTAFGFRVHTHWMGRCDRLSSYPHSTPTGRAHSSSCAMPQMLGGAKQLEGQGIPGHSSAGARTTPCSPIMRSVGRRCRCTARADMKQCEACAHPAHTPAGRSTSSGSRPVQLLLSRPSPGRTPSCPRAFIPSTPLSPYTPGTGCE